MDERLILTKRPDQHAPIRRAGMDNLTKSMRTDDRSGQRKKSRDPVAEYGPSMPAMVPTRASALEDC